MNWNSGETYRHQLRRVGRVLFGDRTGLALFLGTLCFTLAYWRTGILVNDNATLMNTLAALADGHVWIEPATGEYLTSPGTAVRDGFVYGRNYGQLVFALPAFWGLQALDFVANLHVALTALWHLAVLAFALQLGAILDYRTWATYVGSVFVLGSFLLNVAVVTTFSGPSLPLLALQLTTAVTAAATAVVLYRLVTPRRGTELGLLVGAGGIVATPVAFWAVVPKRHVFTTFLIVSILYVFARSRESDGGVQLPVVGTVPAYRAAAYALVGLAAWVSAQEGLYLFVALVLVDIPTAPSNDRRTLATIAVVFGVSLIPLFVTNTLVTGEALKPPRTLSGELFDTASQSTTGGESAGAGGSTGGETGGDSGSLFEPLVAALPTEVVWFTGSVLTSLDQGMNGLLNARRAYPTFIHSAGSVQFTEDVGFRGINLSVLESAPVLGAVAAATAYGIGQRVKDGFRQVNATTVLAVLLAVAIVLTKAGNLPLRVQITVRYLLPVYPLGLLILAYSNLGQQIVSRHRRVLYWSYAVGVCIGSQLLLTAVILGQFSTGEAGRLHALLGVGVGLGVALSCLAATYERRLWPVATAVVGLAAAASTVFVLLASLYYFSFTGEYILPVVDIVVDMLNAV